MLKQFSRYAVGLLVVFILGLVCVYLLGDNEHVYRVGNMLLRFGPGCFVVARLAERYFDAQRARLFSWLFLGAFAMLVLVCVAEIIDPQHIPALFTAQVFLFVGLQIGITSAALGLGGALAMNGLRVRSARLRYAVLFASAAMVCVPPWAGYPAVPIAGALGLGVFFIDNT